MGDSVATSDPDDLGIDGYTDAIRIGQGGFGSVYRCRQVAFDRFVAVKVLAASGLGDAIEERFERECRAIGALSGHPHILTVHDSGISKWKRPFIVMDYMVGGSLAERVRRDGPMAWSDAVAIGVKIAGAVAAAHSAGIVHRDIKPQNILISSYEEPSLGDFGISTIPSGYQTHSGVVTTSLAYAPPEVLNGRPATKASDIYSLAATVLSLIKGSAPFVETGEEGIAALITRTLTQPVPDLRLRAPDSVCAALEQAMSKDPADRQSAAELGHALRSAQTGEGASPTPFVGPDSAASREAAGALVDLSPIEATRSRDRKPLFDEKQDPRPSRRSKGRLIAIGVGALVILGSSGAAVALRDSSRPSRPLATAAPATPEPSQPLAAAPSKAAVRNFTIAYDRSKRVLTGDLTSSAAACGSRRTIELWKRGQGRPTWKGRTSASGRWQARLPHASGVHHARVYEARRGDDLLCRAARSRAVVLRPAPEPRRAPPSSGAVVDPSGGVSPPVRPQPPSPPPPSPPPPSSPPSASPKPETPQEEADCPPGNHVEEDGRCYPD